VSLRLRALQPGQATGPLRAAAVLIAICASFAQAAGSAAPTEQAAQRPAATQQQPASASGASPHAGVPAWIGVDEPPQRLNHAIAAGGPLERHTSRPGAWYTVLYVPLPVRWPVQLMLWQRTHSHDVRISALDGWPGTAGAVIPLPVWHAAMPGGRPLFHTSPFVLAQASAAEGVYLLIEQWSSTGGRPAPLWLQARHAPSPGPDPRRSDGAAWRQTESDRAPSVAPGDIQGPPASALLAPRDALSVIELPFR